MPAPKLRTLVVDDEALARRMIKDYVQKVPALQLVGECTDGIAALDLLRHQPIDLLLLDVNMPELTGLELLASLPNPPSVILTTAYSEYALESYDYGVVDYLLKPITFPRFLKAIERVLGAAVPSVPGQLTLPGVLDIKVDGIPKRVAHADIQYIKSFGNYIRVVTREKTYTTLGTLSHLEQSLPPDFQRIHKSYILNITAVTALEKQVVRVGDQELPVSPLYRLRLFEKLADR